MKIYRRLKDYFFSHKIISGIVLLIVIIGAYYGYNYFFSTSGQTTYLVSQVEKGTIVTAVSGSGQVSAKSQIDIKPKASGEVVYIGVKAGDYVSAGQTIVQLDARDASIALQSAKLTLEKMQASAVSDNG